MVLYTYWDVSYENPNRSLELADEFIYLKHKRDEIRNGNEYICRCPNCSYGSVWEKYPSEHIGQCDSCFEEIRVS